MHSQPSASPRGQDTEGASMPSTDGRVGGGGGGRGRGAPQAFNNSSTTILVLKPISQGAGRATPGHANWGDRPKTFPTKLFKGKMCVSPIKQQVDLNLPIIYGVNSCAFISTISFNFHINK